MMPTTEAFLNAIEKILRDNAAVLDAVGGNLLFHIFNVATWTIVTQGPRLGIYYEETDDPIDFVLMCKEWVLAEMLDPDVPLDVDALVEEGYLVIDGDLAIYERFMGLGERKSSLAVRLSR